MNTTHTSQIGAGGRARSRYWPWYHRRQLGWAIHPAATGALLGFAVFAHSLRGDQLDVRLTSAVQRWHNVDGVMRAVSWLGYSPQYAAVCALLIVLLLVARRRPAALWLLFAVAGGSLLNTAIKVAVARPRPTVADVRILQHASGYSFPSGHVTSYTVLFGFLIGLAFMHLRAAWRWALAAVLAVPIVLVGPSRIYLGDHWASDVLGGYLLGALWLSIVLHTYSEREARLERSAGEAATPAERHVPAPESGQRRAPRAS